MDSRLGQINLIRWQGGVRVRRRGVRPVMVVLFLMAVAGAIVFGFQAAGRLDLAAPAELLPALMVGPWLLWATVSMLRGAMTWLAG